MNFQSTSGIATNPIAVLMILAIFVVFLAGIVLWITQTNASPSSDQLKDDARKTILEASDKNSQRHQDLLQYHIRYLDENLKRSSNVYILSTIMIFAGFFMIAYASWFYMVSISNPRVVGKNALEHVLMTPLPLMIAGVFIEFIAATMLLLFRSVTKQTQLYFQSVDRFTTVGMAIQVLDDLADDEDIEQEMKTRTKAEIAKKILDFHMHPTQSSEV